MMLAQRDPRHHILNRATVAVEKAARNGGLIKATVEARRILSEYELGCMTVDQVADEIARLASERGLIVEFGDAPAP